MNRLNRNMKRGFALAFGLMLMPFNGKATQSTWTNLGNVIYLGSGNTANTVPYPPNIDATNFVNKGFMEIGAAPYPFMTQHTLNFTNDGEMLGEVGWEFDYGPLISGGRGMAASFYNDNYNPNTEAGVIVSYSGSLGNPLAVEGYTYPVGYLIVSATNIVNKGLLEVDAASEINLVGTNVNLLRSFLEVTPLRGVGSINSTNFTPDEAIYDLYWAQTNGTTPIDSSTIWNGTYATSPRFGVTPICSTLIEGTELGPFSPAAASYYTNAAILYVQTTNSSGSPGQVYMVPTNIFRQAAFVNVGDSSISAAIGFTPSANPTNLFGTVHVRLVSSTSGGTLYVSDTLASDPGRGLLLNNTPNPASPCGDPTYRPTNYLVARIGNIGSPGFTNAIPTNFLFDVSWSNNPVLATYAAYSCLVDNQESEPPPNPGKNGNFGYPSITNLPGRIRISAGSLNLNGAQLVGQGGVFIQANHLVSSEDAGVNCENLSFSLGSTNGNLNVVNLAAPTVTRFKGDVSMWSAVWTNFAVNIITNNYAPVTGTNGDTNVTYVLSPITNNIQINLYALLVDAGQLGSTVPVTVYDFALHSTNMVIGDSLSVVESFLLDGTSFTLNGSLNFPGVSPLEPVSGLPFVQFPIMDWVYTTAPTLRYFTNNGSLSIANTAHFGDDGPTNYLAFVNNGVITASAQTIDSSYLLINGGVNESSVGDFTVAAGTAILTNALISAQGDINITAGSLLIDPSVLSAGGALNLAVTSNLSDTGPGAGNALSCNNGFNLLTKPPTGDLWGTTITSTGWYEDVVSHSWAGNDFGTNAEGFTNNVALGTLVLSPEQSGAPLPPLFYFTGTGAHNGLYVSTLDLSQFTSTNELMQAIEVDPSLTIYYAHALVGFTLPPGQSPEGYLQDQFGGRLQWVKSFTALVVTPPSNPPNGKLSVSSLKGGQLQFTLAGASGQTYVVQASTNLVDWVPIYTNVAPASGLLQFVDPGTTNYPSRFYRTVLVQ